jgi:hypothetical protein
MRVTAILHYILVVLILSGTSQTVNAGWLMVEQEGDTSLISNGRLKSSAEGISWILDGPGNKMIFIDGNRKAYASGSVENYCQATATLVDEAMQGLAIEQRKALEEMIQQSQNDAGHLVSVSVVGDGGVVAGLKTVKYRVQVDGELYKEIWLATAPALLREFKPLIPLLQKFGSCANTFGTEFMPENSAEYLNLMERGVEVKSIIYTDNSPEPVTEMVKVENKALPETEFSIPPDYRTMSFEQMLKSQME